MRVETKIKTSKFFDSEDKKRFQKWLIDNDLAMGTAADKLNISSIYLYCIINGQRAVTNKLEKKLKGIGYEL